jgi:hypothetical protein
MAQVHMVQLLTTLDHFEAKVIAARLGAEGVIWELRGGVDGPYPMGLVHIYVEESDLGTARELLAATEETPVDPGEDGGRAPIGLWLVLLGLVVLAVGSLARIVT